MIKRKQIVNLFAWIRGEKVLFINKTKSQTLETLKKHFNVLFTRVSIFSIRNIFPVEYILAITDLVRLHIFAINPYPIFNKMYSKFIGFPQLNGKPSVRERLNLKDKFEKGTLFQ